VSTTIYKNIYQSGYVSFANLFICCELYTSDKFNYTKYDISNY